MKKAKGDNGTTTLVDLDAIHRLELEAALQERIDDTRRQQRAATAQLKRAALEDRIVAEISTALRETLGAGAWKPACSHCTTARPLALPKRPSQGEDAMLVISDPHVGKKIKPKHTLGFGFYNPRIFLDRLHHLESTVVKLLRENVANPVRRLHVVFLGDLVEGGLDHAEEIPSRAYIADQVLLANTAFAQFLARLSTVLPVSVRGVVGNHGRWQNQRKPPTGGRWSNFDFIVMGTVEQLCTAMGLTNVTFELVEAAFDVFDIGKWRFKIGHGDYLKGGDKAMGVPAHAIGRDLAATTARYAARGDRPPDFYVVGDKHRHMSLQTPLGRYMVNGAWFGDDEYAQSANFTPGRPHQMFFGVHPEQGRSWSYDLWLDAAPPCKAPPYALPSRLHAHVMEFPNIDPGKLQ